MGKLLYCLKLGLCEKIIIENYHVDLYLKMDKVTKLTDLLLLLHLYISPGGSRVVTAVT